MQCDHTVNKLSADAVVHCVVKYSRPPDLKSSSNVSLPFGWICAILCLEIWIGVKNSAKDCKSTAASKA